MKRWVLAAIVMAGPAWGQTGARHTNPDFVALVEHTGIISGVSYIGTAATECGHRSRAWLERVNRHYMTQSAQLARVIPGALEGGQDAVIAFIAGAAASGATIAKTEAGTPASQLCARVPVSSVLRQLDAAAGDVR